MNRETGIDLTEGEIEGQPVLRLKCTGCTRDSGDEEWSDEPRLTKPFRKKDDPETVVRCQKCRKKHSDDSLTTAPNQEFVNKYNQGKVSEDRI